MEERISGRLSSVETKAERARKDFELAQQQLVEAESRSRFWTELARHLRARSFAQVLLVLRREEGYVRGLRDAGDAVAPHLEEIRADAEEHARRAASIFDREFPKAAQSSGLEIDRASKHPRYTLRQGFIRLEVDERDLTAKITPRDGAPAIVGLDVGLIVETIQRETTRIFGRTVEPEAFLKRLYTAYVAILRAERRGDGEEVPLRRVMHRMAKNLNRFAADEFNVDLARIVSSGVMTVDGRRMHLNHTRSSGVLLHGLETGGYVGFVSFKKEGSS